MRRGWCDIVMLSSCALSEGVPGSSVPVPRKDILQFLARHCRQPQSRVRATQQAAAREPLAVARARASFSNLCHGPSSRLSTSQNGDCAKLICGWQSISPLVFFHCGLLGLREAGDLPVVPPAII